MQTSCPLLRMGIPAHPSSPGLTGTTSFQAVYFCTQVNAKREQYEENRPIENDPHPVCILCCDGVEFARTNPDCAA